MDGWFRVYSLSLFFLPLHLSASPSRLVYRHTIHTEISYDYNNIYPINNMRIPLVEIAQ